MGGDAVHDMKRHGSTTQDNQGEPNISVSVQTPGVLGQVTPIRQPTLGLHDLCQRSRNCAW